MLRLQRESSMHGIEYDYLHFAHIHGDDFAHAPETDADYVYVCKMYVIKIV